MGIEIIEQVLDVVFPSEIVSPLIISYKKSLIEYRKHHWQYVGNEIGQFVECSRRIIEFRLNNGIYTSFSKKLPIFSSNVLDTWEKTPSTIASESYRLIIPRVLYSMYCIRNKRGMIHKGHISPNYLDASLLLANQKWVLAEIFRLESKLSFPETEDIINSIINKEIDILWEFEIEGTIIRRVLNTKLNARQKILCLLYTEDKQSEDILLKSIEYSNRSSFHKLLLQLHKERLIEFSNSRCILSPLGINQAESILNQEI